ncbi:MAG: hypothetical protein MUF10_05270 [Thermoanaerobaculaceae bacterium]|jgi:hypothetical protein|nr:hypothetical protein [Thermoanaerobaculaceae bacterium]
MAGDTRWRGRPPLDLLVLLGVLFGTFAAQFFAATAWIPSSLRLGPAVWESWALWQLGTYPLVGFGAPDFWFVIELVILFFFARDVRRWLGARRFWLVSIGVAVASAVAAVATTLLWPGAVAAAGVPFQLMQGQRLLMAVMLAAYGALAGDATILLFFVMPVRARFFPAIGLVLAFVAFLASRDLAGLVGIVVATGLAWTVLQRGGAGPALRRLWLRVQRRWTEWRLARLRRRRGFRVLDGGRSGPTIH